MTLQNDKASLGACVFTAIDDVYDVAERAPPTVIRIFRIKILIE